VALFWEYESVTRRNSTVSRFSPRLTCRVLSHPPSSNTTPPPPFRTTLSGAPSSSPVFGRSLPGSGVRRLFPYLFFFSFFFFLFLVPADCSHSLNRYTGPPLSLANVRGGCLPFFCGSAPAAPFCPRTRSGLPQSLGSFFSFLFLESSFIC
jgi:hypothetical protein